MSQNVMVTGCGRKIGLGFAFVKRYLENGDTVIATVRKPFPDLGEWQEKYPGKLHIITMDISSNESCEKAGKEIAGFIPHLDLLINNATTSSPDGNKEVLDVNYDYISQTVDVICSGTLRVHQEHATSS